ncbi:hypothetical protein QE152_g1350 [Popillia japonica]|uniref:Uncharacterized protein n=1 Tax=Popillia japonica TaxID=7064 RepID=A0AAW1N5C1_POPJA
MTQSMLLINQLGSIVQRPVPHSENVPIPTFHPVVQQSQEDDKWKYPNISSVQRPVPHSENVPIPTFHPVVQQSQEDEAEIPISSQADDDSV